MIDPYIHDTTYPFPADIGAYISPIAALFTGGECSAALIPRTCRDLYRHIWVTITLGEYIGR